MNYISIRNKSLAVAVLAVIALCVCGCGKSSSSGFSVSDKQMQEFNQRALEISKDLVLNHTYDRDNLPIADSLYRESEKIGSDIGKKCALRIMYYVYVAYPEQDGEKFLKAVDEYMELAYNDEDKSYYYDAMNAKLYYLIGIEKYMAAQHMIEDVLKEAEKSEDKYGLYFANYMMSTVLQNRDNYELSIEYLLKAEQYADNDSTYLAIINRELSIAYANIIDHETALERSEKSISYSVTPVHKAWADLQNMSCLYNLKRYKEVIKRYETSPVSKGGYEGLLPHYLEIEAQVEYLSSKGEYKKAIELCEDIEFDYVRLTSLFDLYEKVGDYKNALKVKEELDTMDDELKAEIHLEDISEMEAQLGNSQLKLQAENLKVKNIRMTYISIIVIIFILLLALFIISLRHRHYLKELTKKNKELDLAREKAERASNVKSAFIKSMTHELHTPLNHISGFAQVLASEDIPLDEDSTREMSKAIVESSQHLTNMLDNIIEVADTISTLQELEEAEKTMKDTLS